MTQRARTGSLLGAGLAVAVITAAVPGAAVSAGSLAERYAGLANRPDRPAPYPVERPRPIAVPSRAAGARFPLRGPTELRVATDGSVLVADAFTGRTVRLGTDGRAAVLPGRRAAALPACGEHGGIAAFPYSNTVLQAGADGPVTIAGTGRTGFAGDGGPATAARLNTPRCALRAGDGAILVADTGNNRIRRIDPDGTITTLAGNGGADFAGEGGPAASASFAPHGMALTADGAILVADRRNARVLRIAPDGTLTTVAGTGERGYDGDGGPAMRARLTEPWGVAAGPHGEVYVSDFAGQVVRRVTAGGVIDTVLGGGRRPAARRSLALTAWVPRRRVVWNWVNPTPGTWSAGETAVSDEAAAGRVAVIRRYGPWGTVSSVRVVRGDTTLEFPTADDASCWWPEPTATGFSGDPVQGRDLLAGTRGRSPYAPGPGPYAPDLRHGRLVLARTMVTLDATPEFATPAAWSELRARRLVEYLIDPRTGRVVAEQAWSAAGYERQYRIHPRPASLPLRLPRTRPRMHVTQTSPQSSWQRCGPAGIDADPAFGFRDGVALARRVHRRLAAAAAIGVTANGRSATGGRLRATSVFGLRSGRIAAGVTHISAPGTARADMDPPGGSYSEVVLTSGAVLRRLAGESCWRGDGPVATDAPALPVADLSRVMPVEGAFFERPVRRGRLLMLRAHTAAGRVDSLIDPSDMRLVGQVWRGTQGDRGVARVAEVAEAPSPPRITRCSGTTG